MKQFSGRRHVSPSMVVAGLALIVALGSSSYAAVSLPARSVGTKQLRNNAVTRAKIKAKAVNGGKVANDSLTGADIKEPTLGLVPSAVKAGAASTAAAAGSAAALDKVVYRGVSSTVGPAPSDAAVSVAGARASCDAGQHVVGGGVKVDDPSNAAVVDSHPESSTTWFADVDNSDTTAEHGFSVYAICIPSGAVG